MRTHGLLISALALASSCTLIFPLDERDDGTSTTTSSASGVGSTGASTTVSVSSQSGAGTGGGANGGGGESSAGGGGSGGRGGSGGEGGCDPQPSFDEDPNNCGECGHTCGESADGAAVECISGTCQLTEVGQFVAQAVIDLVPRTEDDELVFFYTATTEGDHSFGVLRFDEGKLGGAVATEIRGGDGSRLGWMTVTPAGVVAAIGEDVDGQGGSSPVDYFVLDDGTTISEATSAAPVHHMAFGPLGGDVAIARTDNAGSLLVSVRTGSLFPPEGPITHPAYQRGWNLVVDEVVVYSTALSPAPSPLYRLDPLSGLPPVPIHGTDPTSNVVGLEVDGGFIYWADCGLRRVMRANLDSVEDAELIWESELYPVELAVESGPEGRLHVLEAASPTRCVDFPAGANEDVSSRVFSLPKDGSGPAKLLVDTPLELIKVYVAQDHDYVYATFLEPDVTAGGIVRVHR